MSRRVRYGLLSAGVVIAVCLWQSPGRSSIKSITGGAPAGPGRFVGSSSCSARACHGSLEPMYDNQRILRDEFPKWLLRDKHVGAYHTLFNEKSKNIGRHLRLAHPERENLCLACHALPQFHTDTAELQLGVSCEACHGPAGGWLEAHTGPKWKALGVEAKKATGMLFVTNRESAAAACVGCHVGAAPKGGFLDRDVNHDLIAAGHPRLNFEFSSYLAHLPPHWNEKHFAKEQASLATWLTGQVKSAEAALGLLEHRAQKKDKIWPEFAEYDCFACHHDLQAKDRWRQQVPADGRRPGTLPWGTWYFAMPRLLADFEKRPSKLSDALSKLEGEMTKPLPPTSLSTKPVEAALKELSSRKLDETQLVTLLSKVEGSHGWDVAEQLFLAACALSEKSKNVDKLLALDKHRALPINWSSPRAFAPKEFFTHFKAALRVGQP